MRRIQVMIAVAALLMYADKMVAGTEVVTLSGEWRGVAPDETVMSYTFEEPDKVVWRVEEEGFRQAFPDGLTAKYVIRKGEPFMEIDMYDFEHPNFEGIRFLGILEIVDDLTFKMEGTPSHEGDRPETFSEEAIVFTVVAE